MMMLVRAVVVAWKWVHCNHIQALGFNTSPSSASHASSLQPRSYTAMAVALLEMGSEATAKERV